jgi:hypothetical protein
MFYKRWSQKVLQKIQQCLAEVFSLSLSLIKYIHHALEGDAFLASLSLGQVPVWSSTLIGLNLPLTTLIGIAGRGKMLTYTQDR